MTTTSVDIVSLECGSYTAYCAEGVDFPVPSSIVKAGQDLVTEWALHFQKENNWAQINYGVPGPDARIDGVIDCEGRLRVFELEDRPAGKGLCSRMDPEFDDRLTKMRPTWPSYGFLVSSSRKAMDDDAWLPPFDDSRSDSLVLLRASPDDYHLDYLQGRSVSSFKEEGNKSYGVPLGLWREVGVGDIDSLPWDEGFVLKPMQGTHCRGVLFWNPRDRRAKGNDTRTKIAAGLTASNMYCQPFIQPMPSIIPGYQYMILRIFYWYDPSCQRWVCLGGAANARSNLRIHGATDSVFCPLRIED